MFGVRGQSGRLVGDHSKATWLPHLQHLQPWNRQCLCRFEGPWTSSSKVNTDVLCVDPTEPQNYIFSCTCVDLPTAPTTHPGPPPLQHGVLQQLHFNLRSQSRGCYEVPLWKAIEPHFHLCPSCSQSISQFSFFLCLSFFGKKKIDEYKAWMRLYLFCHTLFDCTHQPPFTPSSALLVSSASGWFESQRRRRRWRAEGWGCEIAAHGNGLVIASPPGVLMEGWSECTPRAPPWWLISLRSPGALRWHAGSSDPGSACQGPPWLHRAS